MNKPNIIAAILSKDVTRVAEAKTAIKEILSARAAQFRTDSAAFVAKSLFEAGGEKDVDHEAMAHHEAAVAHHISQAEVHKPHAASNGSGVGQEHWSAYTKNMSAAESNKRAAAAHKWDTADKHEKSRLAVSASRRANTASEEAHIVEPIGK